MLYRFRPIPERYGQTDGRTDGQTDKIAISISRVSMLTHDKNLELAQISRFISCRIVTMENKQKFVCDLSNVIIPHVE